MVTYKNGVSVRKSNDYSDKEITNDGKPTTFPRGEHARYLVCNHGLLTSAAIPRLQVRGLCSRWLRTWQA